MRALEQPLAPLVLKTSIFEQLLHVLMEAEIFSGQPWKSMMVNSLEPILMLPLDLKQAFALLVPEQPIFELLSKVWIFWQTWEPLFLWPWELACAPQALKKLISELPQLLLIFWILGQPLEWVKTLSQEQELRLNSSLLL